ncbi:MAG: PAS domain S-box protein [Clostridiales bacterium]|nr:PAS domain S-box protein [Clostridiales bacterium]
MTDKDKEEKSVDQNKLQEELAKKTEQLEGFFEVNLDLLCIADVYGNFIKVNKAWEEILGYPSEYLESKRFLDFIHPDDMEKTLIAMSNLENQEEVMHFINRYRCIDGSYRYIEWNSRPNGTLVYASARDITEQHLSSIKIAESEKRYRKLIENSPFPILISSIPEGTILYVNQRTREQLGDAAGEAVGTNAARYYNNPEDRRKMLEIFEKYGRVSDYELELLNGEGKKYTALMSFSLVEFENKPAIMAAINDIDERKKIEDALKSSEEKYRLITENTMDVIWVLNLEQKRFTYISPSIEQLRGYTAEEAMRQAIGESMTEESFKLVLEQLEKNVPVFVQNPELELSTINEIQQFCKNGDIIWVEVSTRLRYNQLHEIEVVGVSRNIEERKKIEAQILYLSYHDKLTGLFNRTYLEERLEAEVNRAKRYDVPVSLIIFDLDFFKNVNDMWGHPTGDEVLRTTAVIVLEAIRNTDVLVRFGGEEFIILMPEATLESAVIAAEKIRSIIENNKYPVAGSITASFGVAERKPFETVDSWYRRLDASLYLAKKSGRNCVRLAD